MKISLLSICGKGVPAVPRKLRRGFTLIELSIAVGMGIAISGMIMVLFRQQLAFIENYRRQNFLCEEAPLISMHVSKLIGKADSFRLHDTLGGPRSAVGAESPVVVLNYLQPDGTTRTSILSFANLYDVDPERYFNGNALYYYLLPPNGVLGEPQWTVTRRPTRVVFTMVAGVLRMRLTGPAGEEITYSGTMQL